MLNLVLFGVFVLFLVAIQFSGGKTVDEIIERHIRAIGGVEKLDTIKTIYFEGLITMMGITKLIKIYQTMENIEGEKYLFNWKITDIADYEYQTSQSPFNNQLTENKMIEGLSQSKITAYLINYIADGSKVSFIGKEVVDEITCNKITLFTSTNMQINYWFNINNGLLNQTSFKNNINNSIKASVIQIKYAMYKTVQGVLLPHKIDISLDAIGTLVEVNFRSIIINKMGVENF